MKSRGVVGRHDACNMRTFSNGARMLGIGVVGARFDDRDERERNTAPMVPRPIIRIAGDNASEPGKMDEIGKFLSTWVQSTE